MAGAVQIRERTCCQSNMSMADAWLAVWAFVERLQISRTVPCRAGLTSGQALVRRWPKATSATEPR
eukprot:822062-Prymnesium_polylepis.4